MRLHELMRNNSTLPLPAFWPSISSIKTNARPYDYFKLLGAHEYPQFLASAYDIEKMSRKKKGEIKSIIAECYSKNRALIIDSGNYEKHWNKDKTWTWKKYGEVIKELPLGFVTTYDDQRPCEGIKVAVSATVSSFRLTAKLISSDRILPIVHGIAPELPAICRNVVKELKPSILCIAERELGMGMLTRIATVRKIRAEIDKVSTHTPIHILGTGNPLSLLLLSLAGADSFDGLEWCQTSVCTDTGTLFHFQHADLLAPKHMRQAHRDHFFVSTLANNLYFFESYMNKIRNNLAGKKGISWAIKCVRKDARSELRDILSGTLK